MKKRRLIQSEVNGKVYLIDCGRRRWLKDTNRLAEIGLRWPEDIELLGDDAIRKIPLGASVPLHAEPLKKSRLTSMEEARESVVSCAKGRGVEFGAAANPMPVPLGSEVRYADLFATPVLEEELYDEHGSFEYVPLDLQTSFDTMHGIMSGSLDFIIASHVIEHVRDPIGAILLSMEKLKSSGKLILVVPKMERTLDANRALTSLEHLALDHTDPSRERDALHVIEFHAYAKPDDLKNVYEKAIHSIHDDYHSMHYHVWNEKNFKQMLKFVSKSSKGFRIESFTDALNGDENYEFYVVLQKL